MSDVEIPAPGPALPQIQIAHIDGFTPFALNARSHPEAQIEELASSILEFGWVWPVLKRGDSVIGAGHGRREAAKLIYGRGLRIKMWNGFELPLDHLPFFDVSHWSEAQFKAYVLIDNRSAEKAEWDKPTLQLALAELAEFNFDMDAFGFAEVDLADIFGDSSQAEGGLSENYSRKIEAPIYEITGEKPAVSDLLDERKTNELKAEIQDADLSDDVRAFLLAAADRHTVFNFRNIAEFYAHADAPLQRLMERSALVIIDFDQAIEQGFVRLSEGMMEQAELSKARMAARDAQ